MAMPTSADIRAEIAELTATTQALLAVAEEQGRDFDPEEEQGFNENADKIKALQNKLQRAEDREGKARMIAELAVAQSQPNAPVGGAPIKAAQADRSRVHHRLGPLKAFKGPDAIRDAYDSGMWLRAVLFRENRQRDEHAEARIAARGWSIYATATEGSPTGGGYLVPTPLSNTIIDIRAMAGVSRQVCSIEPMTSETLDIPKVASGTTVYYPGEAGAVTASDQSWGQVELKVKKRGILAKVSQELRDDAVISIMDNLASQMGTDFALKEDSELIDGDGTSTYGGEIGLLAALGAGGVSTAATGHDLWSEIDNADITAWMGLLPSKYQVRNPSIICSSQFYHNVLLRLLATAGGNTIQTLEEGGSPVYRYLGKRVYVSDFMPTATAAATVHALYGAFPDAVKLGDRGGIEFAMSEHLNFAEALIALRALTRYDINVHEPGTASVPGAYVGLKTAA